VTPAHGLSDDTINALAEDDAGNLWIGTDAGGAMKLASSGFLSYREGDGLTNVSVDSFFETRSGRLCCNNGTGVTLHCLDGTRFAAVRPDLRAVTAGGLVPRRTPA
jgi:ligand-binding sensor domain-containing protein